MTPKLIGLLGLALGALGGAVLGSPAGADENSPSAWTVSAQGQTLLRPFRNAPYPHRSREKGYTYNGTLFDAAGHYSDSTVGIFIPAGYKPSEAVGYVVHFHGWSNHVAAVLDHYELRDQLAASGRNAILISPQGPKDASDSGGGRLELEPGAFEALLGEVTEFLFKAGKIHTTHIGHIALSAHSGGYNLAGAILMHGGLSDRVSDVLLFDASYGGLERFADWLKEGRGRRLISIFTAHLAPENFTLISMLRKLHVPLEMLMESDLSDEQLLPRRGLFIHTTDLPHDEIMQKRAYFARFLRTSALAKRPH